MYAFSDLIYPQGDPHGELASLNVLIERRTINETAAHFKKPAQQIEQVRLLMHFATCVCVTVSTNLVGGAERLFLAVFFSL